MIEVVVVMILFILFGMALIYLITYDNENDLTVERVTSIAGNKTILSTEILFGQVTGSVILDDNRTRIEYKLGTVLFGWDNHDRIFVKTDEIFAPNDNIKITARKVLNEDCRYYLSNGTEVERPMTVFTPIIGDYCGVKTKEYEVELLK